MSGLVHSGQGPHTQPGAAENVAALIDHPLDGQFEPAAEAWAKAQPRIPASEIAQISTAISLKRIADHLAGTDARTGLVDALYDLGNPNR